MRVLHICNDFAGSKVHTNLVRKLSRFDELRQEVYCPVRKPGLLGGNAFETDRVDFHYSYVIKPAYKYLYHYKIGALYRDMAKHVRLEHVDLIHATTLFSDGGVAYRAYKKNNIPYVVAVRSVDIEFYAKIQPHAWHLGREILLNARKIYFISPALMDEFRHLRFTRPVLSRIEEKFVLRCNGIDDFWLQNLNDVQTSNHQIIYIGSLIPRKNVARLIEAVDEVRKVDSLKDTGLTIVGAGNDQTIMDAIERNSDFVNYVGPIKDKQELMQQMRQHAIFAMPSLHDTFGLTYLEALSQQLPVLFTKGQGIDGVFDNEEQPVGEGVTATSVESIAGGIRKMLETPERYSNRQVDFSLFDWGKIAERYLQDYEQLIG